MEIWVVVFGNYFPAEVIEVYDNKAAADEYVDDPRSDSELRVERWTVQSTYDPASRE
ncbi:hypothetical protein [Frankia sp. AgW1.1]|uniref:hypothetical protein n=1 Tax=Frankia sp. AgW1.1 TaxID=1836971 RepID=UPI0019320A4C|nr:hypothetical protein [Frankia sp. AgW1.1]MBL7487082.1 hypothetical protein [Frankia sp. AgW1.1]